MFGGRGSLVVRWWTIMVLWGARPAVLWRWTTGLARLRVVSVGEWVVVVGAVEAGHEVPERILLVEEAD